MPREEAVVPHKAHESLEVAAPVKAAPTITVDTGSLHWHVEDYSKQRYQALPVLKRHVTLPRTGVFNLVKRGR